VIAKQCQYGKGRDPGILGWNWGKLTLSFPRKVFGQGIWCWQAICLFIGIKTLTMGNLLYLIAVILVLSWAIGYFAYGAGGIIHILLVIAIIAILLKVIRREGI
jgi:hypothetical protein